MIVDGTRVIGDGDDDETGATDGLKRKLSNAFCYFLIHRYIHSERASVRLIVHRILLCNVGDESYFRYAR